VTELHVRHHGEGPAVLWLHGYTMDSSLWEPSWCSLPGWHHIGVDLPGHGGSGPLARGTTRTDVGRWVADVARAHGAERVVALSFGTVVALELALGHPDVAAHLVLGAPSVPGGGHAEGTAHRYRELLGLRRFLGPGRHLTERWMTSPPDIFAGTEAHPELRERVRRVVDAHPWDELGDDRMGVLTAGQVTDDELGAVRARTLVLVGDQDMPAFHANAARLGRALPRCRVLDVPDAGHLPLLEVPARLATTIDAHLGGSDDTGSRVEGADGASATTVSETI